MTDTIQYLPGWHVKRSADGGLKDCSLIIATYKRPQELLTLLEVLLQLPDVPEEVVVVDGDAPEEHEKQFYHFLKDQKLPFDFTYVKSPKGLTRQRNVGIDISSHAYVFFLDDDCLPQPGYFLETQKVFLADSAGKVGGVCGLNINEVDRRVARQWRIQVALGLVPPDHPKIYRGLWNTAPLSTIKPFTGIRPVDILNGNAMAFRREVLNENRFSKFFHGYSFGEDLEISLRIGRKWEVLWCGDARVVHNKATGGRPPSFHKGKMDFRNLYFIRNRYATTGDVKDILRFWMNLPFLMVMDLAWFVARPWRPEPFLHALGLAWSSLDCLISPPAFEEPPAMREYGIRLEPLNKKVIIARNP